MLSIITKQMVWVMENSHGKNIKNRWQKKMANADLVTMAEVNTIIQPILRA